MLNQAKLRVVVHPTEHKSTLWLEYIDSSITASYKYENMIAYAPSAPERINSGSKQFHFSAKF